jgi:hypothetical protein
MPGTGWFGSRIAPALRGAVPERAVASLTNGVSQRFAPASWQRAPGRRHDQERFRAKAEIKPKTARRSPSGKFVSRVKPSSFKAHWLSAEAQHTRPRKSFQLWLECRIRRDRCDCLFVKSPTILRCVGEVDNPNAPSSVVEIDYSEILGLNNKHMANRVNVALTPVYAELLELGVVRLHGDPKGVDQLL